MKVFFYTFCICFIILTLRFPPSIENATFIYEDGTYFYQQHLISNSFRLVLQPFVAEHSGSSYYLLLSRLIFKFVTATLPVKYAAFAVNIIGILFFSLSLSLISLPRFKKIIYPQNIRVLLVFVLALSSHSFEWLANASNVFWVLIIPLVLIFLSTNKVYGINKIFLFIIGFVLSMSTPFSILILPLLLLYRRYRVSNLFGVILGISLQLYQSYGYSQAGKSLESAFLVFFNALPLKIITPSVFGYLRSVTSQSVELYFYLSYLVLFIVVIGVYLYRKRGDSYRLLISLYFIIISSFLSIYSRNLEYSEASALELNSGARYYYTSIIFFTYLVFLFIYRVLPKKLSFLTLVLIFSLSLYRNYNYFPNYNIDMQNLAWSKQSEYVEKYLENLNTCSKNPELSVPIFKFPFSLKLPVANNAKQSWKIVKGRKIEKANLSCYEGSEILLTKEYAFCSGENSFNSKTNFKLLKPAKGKVSTMLFSPFKDYALSSSYQPEINKWTQVSLSKQISYSKQLTKRVKYKGESAVLCIKED